MSREHGSTEWLDVLMNLHDNIKPEMRHFADRPKYEDDRWRLAGRMIETYERAQE